MYTCLVIVDVAKQHSKFATGIYIRGCNKQEFKLCSHSCQHLALLALLGLASLIGDAEGLHAAFICILLPKGSGMSSCILID